jgi:hypothetical protein
MILGTSKMAGMSKLKVRCQRFRYNAFWIKQTLAVHFTVIKLTQFNCKRAQNLLKFRLQLYIFLVICIGHSLC